MENITLYYRENGSDKIYRTAIEAEGDGYVVTFTYGRRGSTLSTGRKTPEPVPLEQARKVYEKLVASKTAKGYTPREDGVPYTEGSLADTGIRPQLLNPIEDPSPLIENNDWWMQEKLDGRRMLLLRKGDSITAINRRGLETSMPVAVRDAAMAIKGDFLLDGESVGEHLYVFDLLEWEGRDLRSQPYHERYAELMRLFITVSPGALALVTTAYSPQQKRSLMAVLRDRNAEGVVFKHQESIYTPGNPGTGGSHLKLKFYETASCIVEGINSGKCSVSLCVMDGASRRGVGNVTIPPNREVPKPGTIVEIRYLYAFPEGSLYQPVYLGERDDLTESDCTTIQLKLKPVAA